MNSFSAYLFLLFLSLARAWTEDVVDLPLAAGREWRATKVNFAGGQIMLTLCHLDMQHYQQVIIEILHVLLLQDSIADKVACIGDK
jgi:hypothetical protein